MFDQEEKEKSLEQEVMDLQEDVHLLRIRVSSLEGEMEKIKEQLRKMSFTPGL
ncbi:MAG: hypothetical protein OEY18_02110 [Candidatus Aminicenantes bacterium]|nr:hypothetical protein [Candidatus Aminicenantes bacterium]MDH5383475.1 hypothetical protein [Candidatus Aminicenantes bacterium]MDH5743422.1 hypothetical protein [Candidatus Aminicenantes bacterium]